MDGLIRGWIVDVEQHRPLLALGVRQRAKFKKSLTGRVQVN